MLAGMIEVQQLVCVRPTIFDYTPDPWRAVSDGQGGSGSSQAMPQGFPVQSTPHFQGLALPANDYFVQQFSPFRANRLFLRVKYSQLLFMPFHAGLRRFVLSPAGPSKTHQVSIQQ